MYYYRIVEVIGEARLLDAQSREHSYRTTDGHPLARGIYVAHWPSEIVAPRYDAYASYVGPFPSWLEAGDFILDATHGWSEPIGSAQGDAAVTALNQDPAPAPPDDQARKLSKAVHDLVEKGWIRVAAR